MKKHFRAITDSGTKKELMFATKTLGREGEDWKWMVKSSVRIGDHTMLAQYAVGIRKEAYDRIDKKYSSFNMLIHHKK